MVPFVFNGEYEVVALLHQETIKLPIIATLKDKNGKEHKVSMVQKWPH